jgi:hypothetical protein
LSILAIMAILAIAIGSISQGKLQGCGERNKEG